MNRQIVATIASKDLSFLGSRRSVRASILAFPLLVAVGLPLIVRLESADGGGIPAAVLPRLLDSFSFFFVIGAASLPTAIASYSLVGEKVEHSLEPLLATPVTDGEILLGKSIAAVVPPLAGIYVGAALFMVLCDLFSREKLGYLYFPGATSGVIFLVVAPLAAILCVEFNVIISARVSDVRAAQQIGAVAVLPFAVIYVASEIGLFTLDLASLGVMSAVLGVVDLGLSFGCRAIFQRERILTTWK